MKLLVKGDDNPRVVQVGRTRDAKKWMRQYGQVGEMGEVWQTETSREAGPN